MKLIKLGNLILLDNKNSGYTKKHIRITQYLMEMYVFR
jgi:hypothetical protein